jgi:hypothetical protein
MRSAKINNTSLGLPVETHTGILYFRIILSKDKESDLGDLFLSDPTPFITVRPFGLGLPVSRHFPRNFALPYGILSNQQRKVVVVVDKSLHFYSTESIH